MNFNKNIFEPKNQTFNKIKKTNKNSQFILLPTSGTTGKAKVVALSQKSTYVLLRFLTKKWILKKSLYKQDGDSYNAIFCILRHNDGFMVFAKQG